MDSGHLPAAYGVAYYYYHENIFLNRGEVQELRFKDFAERVPRQLRFLGASYPSTIAPKGLVRSHLYVL